MMIFLPHGGQPCRPRAKPRGKEIKFGHCPAERGETVSHVILNISCITSIFGGNRAASRTAGSAVQLRRITVPKNGKSKANIGTINRNNCTNSNMPDPRQTEVVSVSHVFARMGNDAGFLLSSVHSDALDTIARTPSNLTSKG